MRGHSHCLRAQTHQLSTSHCAVAGPNGVRPRCSVVVGARRVGGGQGFLSDVVPLFEPELDSKEASNSASALPPLESELPSIPDPEPTAENMIESTAPLADAALLDNSMVPYWDPEAPVVDVPQKPPPQVIRPAKAAGSVAKASTVKPASAPPARKVPIVQKSKAPGSAAPRPSAASTTKSTPAVIRPTPRRQASLTASLPSTAPSRLSPPPPSTATTSSKASGADLGIRGFPNPTTTTSPGSGSDREGEAPVLQQAPADPKAAPTVDWAYQELPMQGFLQLRSEEEELSVVSRQVELPPLQSVLELTTAFKPPTKSLEAVAEEVATETATETAAAPVGRQLPDGAGTLADGTTYEKLSGEEFGPNGFWKKWTMLKGASADGTVTFEECWWEASDYSGLKELGATKSGNSALGGAWNETWTEKAYHDAASVELVIERTAHKWARADGGEGADEWEEKWGEKHKALGEVTKYADKWAKSGADIWHERWGEDYTGRGGCTKWTDKWAERFLPGGAREQWGDKWTEIFADGRGEKHGEVWSVGGGGERYNRWWNEEHMGNGQVRKYGNSNHGEHWDVVEHMDTYYNPIPHFGFALAVRHSPGLMKIPMRPRGASPEAGGGEETQQQQGGKPKAQPLDVGTMALLGGLDAFNGEEEEQEEQASPQPALPTSATATTTTASPATSRAPRSPSPDPTTPTSPGSASGSTSLDWSEVLASVQSKVDAAVSRPAVQKARSSSASPRGTSPASRDPSKVTSSKLLGLAGAGAGGQASGSPSPQQPARPASSSPPPPTTTTTTSSSSSPAAAGAAAKQASDATKRVVRPRKQPPPPSPNTSGLGGGLDMF